MNDQKAHQSFTIFGQNLYGIQRLKVSIFFVILSTKYSSDSIDSGSNDYQIMKKFWIKNIKKFVVENINFMTELSLEVIYCVREHSMNYFE